MARRPKPAKHPLAYERPMYDRTGRVTCIKRFWLHPTKGWRWWRVAGPERASKNAIALGALAAKLGGLDKLRAIPKSLRR